MKKILAVVALLGLGVACLIPLACGNNPTPAAPKNPGPTPTPIPTPAFYSNIKCIGIVLGGGGLSFSSYADLYLQVNNQPVTDATVVLIGSNFLSPVTLAYAGPVTSGPVYSLYSAHSGWTYRTGQIYTLKAITSLGTDEATLTAPGGVTLASDGHSVSWAIDGNSDSVNVRKQGGSNTFFTTAEADSPVAIPSSAFPSSGTYRFTVSVSNYVSDTTGGTGSSFNVYEAFDADFIFTGTLTPTPTTCGSCTPTFTATATSTPSPSETPIPTSTATFTPSDAPTFSLTPTFSPTVTLTPTSTPTFTATSTPTVTPTGTSTPLCASPSIFGHTAGSVSASFPNLLDASRYNLSAPGTVVSLGAYLPSGSGSLRMAIYSDNAGSPNNLLAQTSPQTAYTGTNILPLSPPLALPAGNYWLAYQIQGSSTIAYDTGAAGSEAYVTSFAYGSFPATFPAFTFANFNWYLEGRYCP